MGEVGEFELVEVMRAARRLTAWAESLELAVIAELDRRRRLQAGRCGSWTVEMDRALCDENSAALTLSGTAAAIRLGIAGKLAELLPKTRQALAEGRIDAAKARAICDGVLGVSDETARRVERLARGHHRLKQHPDWTLIQPWRGVLLWITPTGHWHLTGPDPDRTAGPGFDHQVRAPVR